MTTFRRAFLPTPEEEKKDLERLAKLHFSNIGQCCTCANYIGSQMPGFVTDYGECKLNLPIFPRRVCSQEEIDCESYEMSTGQIEHLISSYASILGKIRG